MKLGYGKRCFWKGLTSDKINKYIGSGELTQKLCLGSAVEYHYKQGEKERKIARAFEIICRTKKKGAFVFKAIMTCRKNLKNIYEETPALCHKDERYMKPIQWIVDLRRARKTEVNRLRLRPAKRETGSGGFADYTLT